MTIHYLKITLVFICLWVSGCSLPFSPMTGSVNGFTSSGNATADNSCDASGFSEGQVTVARRTSTALLTFKEDSGMVADVTVKQTIADGGNAIMTIEVDGIHQKKNLNVFLSKAINIRHMVETVSDHYGSMKYDGKDVDLPNNLRSQFSGYLAPSFSRGRTFLDDEGFSTIIKKYDVTGSFLLSNGKRVYSIVMDWGWMPGCQKVVLLKIVYDIRNNLYRNDGTYIASDNSLKKLFLMGSTEIGHILIDQETALPLEGELSNFKGFKYHRIKGRT